MSRLWAVSDFSSLALSPSPSCVSPTELRVLFPKPAGAGMLLVTLQKKGSTFKLVWGMVGQSWGFFSRGGGLFFFSAGPLRDFTMLKCIVTLQERVRG